MFGRTAASHPHHTAKSGHIIAAVLFAVALLFGILVMLRYAYGWTEAASEGATADSLVAIASAAVMAVGAVWL